VLEEYAGGVAYTAPANVYLALCTTSAGRHVDRVDDRRDRLRVVRATQIGTGNNQTDAWNAATGTTTATVTNKNAITAPTATGASTNPIVGIAVVDASSAGNVLVWASVTSTAIANGDTPKINAAGGNGIIWTWEPGGELVIPPNARNNGIVLWCTAIGSATATVLNVTCRWSE
jgi:hypothetical protein